MLKSLANSFTGLRAHQQALDIVAHNLANVNTVAYKEKQVSFADLPGRTLAERRLPVAGEQMNPRISGRGVALSSVTSLSENGSLAFTGRNLDLAIAGEGYFRVIRPDGTYAYTRAGNFTLDAEGHLVDGKGARLDFSYDPQVQVGNLDFSTLKITSAGDIWASSISGAEGYFPEGTVKVGELSLFRFTNPQGLYYIGDNLLLPSEASGPPLEGKAGEAGFGVIRAGFLEEANVDTARQMVMLIRGQRGLQASARTAVTAEELWALTLNVQA